MQDGHNREIPLYVYLMVSYLHGVGQLVSTDTLQNKHFLEVIQVSIPVPGEWFSMRLNTVKYLFEAFGMLTKLLS